MRLIHWKAGEAEEVLRVLRSAGHEVRYDEKFDSSGLRQERLEPSEAFVIDLSRLPSHGREVAIALRGSKKTRAVPIVFVGGQPDKVEAIREQLPDATYTSAKRLTADLKKAIAQAPSQVVVPVQMMDRFAGRTAAQKLGITAGCKVTLIDAPRNFAHVLGALPDGVEFDEDSSQPGAVTLWFVSDSDNYLAMLTDVRPLARRSKLWVLWRKKTEIKENFLRDNGISVGLVDYKVCSVDSTWSGLLFALKSP